MWFGLGMSEANFRFMQIAVGLAAENVKTNAGGPFGCVIVKSNQIVGKGANSVTSSNDPTAHAEVNAIRDACQALGTFVLNDCELYTSCEPCPMCLAAIYWARISKVYFCASKSDAAKAGFDDEFFYRELKLPIDQRSLPMTNILPEQASVPFEAWIKSSTKIPY